MEKSIEFHLPHLEIPQPSSYYSTNGFCSNIFSISLNKWSFTVSSINRKQQNAFNSGKDILVHFFSIAQVITCTFQNKLQTRTSDKGLALLSSQPDQLDQLQLSRVTNTCTLEAKNKSPLYLLQEALIAANQPVAVNASTVQ